MHRRNTKQIRKIGLMLSLMSTTLGCFERDIRAIEPCTRARFATTQTLDTVDSVDLLFMVDNSGSMKDERDAIAREIPRLVNLLTTGGANDPNVPDFTPVRSLHLGVVTSDMGVGRVWRGAGCDARGDDGIVQTLGDTSTAGCSENYPPGIFTFVPDGGVNAQAFGAQIGCVVRGVNRVVTGQNDGHRGANGGCGVEQQLESALKAISPAQAESWTAANYQAPVFFEGAGHGGTDGANAGFVRENSALAVVFVSDEEDSSTATPDLAFARDEPRNNIRVVLEPDLFSPIERYRDGFLALRRDPKRLVYAAIVGVPTSTTANDDYSAILDAPTMQYESTTGTTLKTVCGDFLADGTPDPARSGAAGTRGAAPGRRFVELARQLEQRNVGTAVQSICPTEANQAPNYQGAIDVLIRKIAGALAGSCLPRAQNPDAQGLVRCDVIETLSDEAAACGAGRESAGSQRLANGSQVQRCLLRQLPIGQRNETDIGWYYDNSAEAAASCNPFAQRLKVTKATEVQNGRISFECLQTVTSADAETATMGAFCDPARNGTVIGTSVLCSSGFGPNDRTPLTCDPVLRACNVPCTDTSDCENAGLFGQVCDTRLKSELGSSGQGLNDPSPYNFCVNPLCNDVG